MSFLVRTEIFALVLIATFAASRGAGFSPVDRIELAAKHLGRVQQEDGFFRYQFDFVTGHWTEDNNIVRQAGAGYALGEYLRYRKNPEIEAHLRRAVQAYRDSSMEWKSGRLLTVSGNYKKAKSGATALALISAQYYREVSGDKRFDHDIHAWVDGLLSLRNKNAGFSKRPRLSRESPYSNGEIWLALANHIQQFPGDIRVIEALNQIDGIFLDRYGKKPDIGFFHWGVMAAEKRYRQTTERRFVDFAAQQAIQYLEEMRPRVNPASNSCYAVEGLAAVMGMLEGFPEYSAVRHRLADRISEEMKKNLRLQITPGQSEIALGRGRTLINTELADHAGAFLDSRRRPQIRIDATQHCLSALLKTRHLDL